MRCLALTATNAAQSTQDNNTEARNSCEIIRYCKRGWQSGRSDGQEGPLIPADGFIQLFLASKGDYMKQIKGLSEENLSEIISLCSISNDLTSICSRSRLTKMKHVFVFGSVKLLNDFSWRLCWKLNLQWINQVLSCDHWR